jgi:hypothetical protein
MSVAWVGAGIAAVSAVSGAKSAKGAAKAQAQSAAEATQLQREQYDQTREDNAPYRERGNQAGNRLQYLMGLDSGADGFADGTIGGGSGGASTRYDPLKDAELVDMSNGTPSPNADLYNNNPAYQQAWNALVAENQRQYGKGFTTDSSGSIIESALRANLAGAMAGEREQTQQAQAKAEADPQFGSLLRKFTMADRDADPVYQSGLQFGLNEGTKAINSRAGAGGSFLSGATLKALTRFGNDYGSTKANESYNRFNNDQTTTYNRLAGIAGTGQNATNQVSAAGQNYATNAGNNIMGAGNAQAAGIIGGANALNNGISQGYGMYQNNQLMNQIQKPGGSTSQPSQSYPQSQPYFTTFDGGQ